jgi:ribosome recycling factor
LTPSKKTLRKVKRDRIKFYRELKKGGYITKEQFKEAKKEIKKYTDY